jgi:hypothetical protein
MTGSREAGVGDWWLFDLSLRIFYGQAPRPAISILFVADYLLEE